MRLYNRYIKEIQNRGGEITIMHAPFAGCGWKKVEERSLSCLGRGKSDGHVVYLLGCDGWRYYSRSSKPRFASLRYLVGRDDSGLWAIRIPGTIETVRKAVEWITPAAVHKARRERRKVLRQGNLYLVRSPQRGRNDFDGDFRWGDHEYYHRARVLLHPEHRPRVVPPVKWQAVEQKSLSTNRGGASD